MIQTLFSENTIYVSNQTSQTALFSEIANDLIAKKLVTEDFLESIIHRENTYPTGLDLQPVSKDFPNIAIPHTESHYVNATRIIPIKLQKKITFNNMIDPSAELDTSFLFMILNKNLDEQASLLANIMDFINGCNHDDLLTFFQYDNPSQIFNFLQKNFKQEAF